MHSAKLLHKRINTVAWIILPGLLMWISVNYLVGLNKKVNWGTQVEGSTQVLGAKDEYFSSDKPTNYSGHGAVTLWFDDAWYSQYSIAFPLLENHKYPAALSVPTSLVAGESYMTWPEIKKLQYRGWEIASHSVNHICDTQKTDLAAIKYEMVESLKTLEEKGLTVENYVSPCGVNDPSIIALAKDSYLSFRTTNDGLNNLPVDNPYALNIYAVTNASSLQEIIGWMNQAELKNKWLIIVFHQIGYNHDKYEITPELLEAVLKSLDKTHLAVMLPNQVLQISPLPVKK